AETCPARAFEAWQAVARRKAGPLFRRISSAGRIGEAALHPDAGDPGAACPHGGARRRWVRAAERTCAARRLHHRSLRQRRAGRGHHAPHPASRFAHYAWLRAARRPGDGKPGWRTRSLMEIRFPWEADAEPVSPSPTPSPDDVGPKPRGRRRRTSEAAPAADGWLYHHLTVSGPTVGLSEFAAAARGAGVIPWRLDVARIEEDLFNLAAAQPPAQRRLTIAGCRLLARQFRERVEAHHAKAVARVGHWGTQCLRHVEVRPGRPGWRLPAGHAVIGYGFFTEGETPQAAMSALASSWPELRFLLRPVPPD